MIIKRKSILLTLDVEPRGIREVLTTTKEDSGIGGESGIVDSAEEEESGAMGRKVMEVKMPLGS